MASSLLILLSCLAFSSAHRIEILTTPLPDGGSVSDLDCSSPADVIFILDGSKSMSPDDFQKQKDFVTRFIEDMAVSKDKVRIGVTTFSTKVHTAFGLDTHRSKSDVLAAIGNIDYPQGRTHTWLVLDYLREDAFTVDNGGRYGVPKIAIILTDGESQEKDKTIAAAALLHKNPIRVYAIGVGNYVNKEELKAIASKTENLYYVPDFSALKTIEDAVIQNVCKKVCGVNPVDIIFMLDESTSIWDDEFKKQMDFLVSFIKDSVIGPKYTQIGVVTFSTDTINRFFLNAHKKMNDLLNAVKAIEQLHGDTYTNKALDFIAGQGFTAEHGGRKGAPHIVIIITDGQSTMPILTKKSAEAMRASGVDVFAIGVGNEIDPNELKILAGKDSRVFTVVSYDALKTIESALFSKVCKVVRTDH